MVQKDTKINNMLRRIIHRLLYRRHPWRTVSFDEIAQLYVSRLMTVFAINIINLFAAIYLFNLGYDLVFIAFFYAALYFMKVVISPLAGRYVAYYGPKRAIFAANLIRIPSLLFFLGVEQYGIWMVIAFGVVQQISSCLYDLAYLVNFSRVKHPDHAGKEIGTMQILEKAARIVSPLVGGVLATVFSPQVTIAVAVTIFTIAAWPLFLTAEQSPTKYKLEMHRIKLRKIWRTFIGEGVVGYDFVTSGVVWSLFLVAVVFTTVDDNIYAIVGLLASVGVLVSAIGAYSFGHMIDRKRGAELLTNTVILKSIIHMVRPISVMPVGAVANGLASEVATTGFGMAFLRAMFDRADDAPSRVGYMTYMEIAVNLGASIACTVFGVALLVGGMAGGFGVLFVSAAFVQLLMLFSRRYA